jgi:Fur family transcriptional regulator, iron response regulator
MSQFRRGFDVMIVESRDEDRQMLFNPAHLPLFADRQKAFCTARIESILKSAGLRATRQRQVLGALLFESDHRRVTADDLHREALSRGVPLSLATVYNTLNQFVEGGLVRRVSVNGERTYFDTDPGDHHHFYIEAEDRLMDIPPEEVRFSQLPTPPDGYAIDKVDVVVHLKRVSQTS